MKFQCEYIFTHPGRMTPLTAAHIVKIVQRSSSEVSIEVNGHCTNCLDVSGLLALCIANGDLVNVIADGRDGYDVMKNIETVLLHHTERGGMPAGQRWLPQLVSA